ncbi:hypothetical protein XA68_17187 [Ophiocordyceps unilateralis]|uniref:DRBM domain-containing protein n=1 Tax=Ophiocordyceps unilateralis TaxID=268505 RepID=A0A2A9P5A7_OPHUN|nr:hypothetical protein XA68_17187 [Ophiocordyceps unilateralis]
MATSSTYSPTESNSSARLSWQERLDEVCRQANLHPPVFQIVSDRRELNVTDSIGASGGRTAWSSTVVVHGKTLEARYWYDGKYLNNAKEDAAECALNWLNTTSRSWSHW